MCLDHELFLARHILQVRSVPVGHEGPGQPPQPMELIYHHGGRCGGHLHVFRCGWGRGKGGGSDGLHCTLKLGSIGSIVVVKGGHFRSAECVFGDFCGYRQSGSKLGRVEVAYSCMYVLT